MRSNPLSPTVNLSIVIECSGGGGLVSDARELWGIGHGIVFNKYTSIYYLIVETYKSEIAHQVIVESISQIKEAQIDLVSFANKLLEKKIINENERKEAIDKLTGSSADDRMVKLLDIVKVSIKLKGKVFGDFLEILKEEGNIRTEALAEKLEKNYRRKQS